MEVAEQYLITACPWSPPMEDTLLKCTFYPPKRYSHDYCLCQYENGTLCATTENMDDTACHCNNGQPVEKERKIISTITRKQAPELGKLVNCPQSNVST